MSIIKTRSFFDFPKIEITLPKEDIHKRFTMKIYIEVKSVFGRFSRTTYI